jgi:hypothetical protein
VSISNSTDTPDGYPENYVDPADRLMLAALRGGGFILAVACTVCGRPLTAQASKARGVGPDCRRKTTTRGADTSEHRVVEGAA